MARSPFCLLGELDMRIQDREKQLFEEWSKNRKGFVADGVIDENAYLNSCPRLMFILKEVNDPDGGNWDLREFIRDGAREQTWSNITRWTYGIRSIEKDIAWDNLQQITEEQRKEILKSICAINLKKSPGGHTTNKDILATVAFEDKIYFKEQFSFYDPDLVICCGSVVSRLFHNLVSSQLEPKWKMTKRGIWYHEYAKNKYVIEFSHPEARVADCFLYYGLIDAVREIWLEGSDPNDSFVRNWPISG